MRYLLVLLLLSSQAMAAESALDFHRPDHRMHGAVSYGLTLTGTTFFRKAGLPTFGAWLASGLVTMGIGLIKEARDPEFSVGDMKANTFGVLSSGAFSLVIQL